MFVTISEWNFSASRPEISVFPPYPRKGATLFSLKIRRSDPISALNRTAESDENTISVTVEFSST